jgi:hypothetical protein
MQCAGDLSNATPGTTFKTCTTFRTALPAICRYTFEQHEGDRHEQAGKRTTSAITNSPLMMLPKRPSREHRVSKSELN